MSPKKQRSHCPINFALEVFGDKWTLLIIRDIILFGKRYYNEFLNSGEKIATNILADRLARLEKEEMVEKRRDEAHGARFVYRPTRKMIDLLPILLEMVVWSAKYDPETEAPPEVVERIIKNRDVVIKEYLAAIAD